VAFAARYLQKQQLLVRKIGVDRRLADRRLTRNIIHDARSNPSRRKIVRAPSST
jgi:hypothetical protein